MTLSIGGKQYAPVSMVPSQQSHGYCCCNTTPGRPASGVFDQSSMRHPSRSYRVFVPVELHANPANAMTSMLQSTNLLSMRAVRLSAAIVAALAMPPAIAAAQSFDCRAARSADEMTICQNGDLARLDQQLAAAYRRD